VSRPARPHRRRRVVIGAVVGAALAAATVTLTLNGLPAQAGSLPTSTQFYADPNSQAARWVAANPGDSRASAINSRIAQVPSGIWFASYNPSTITSNVSAVTSAAKSAGKPADAPKTEAAAPAPKGPVLDATALKAARDARYAARKARKR